MLLASTYNCGVKASIAHHGRFVDDLRFALRCLPKRLRCDFDTNRTDSRGGARSVALATAQVWLQNTPPASSVTMRQYSRGRPHVSQQHQALRGSSGGEVVRGIALAPYSLDVGGSLP